MSEHTKDDLVKRLEWCISHPDVWQRRVSVSLDDARAIAARLRSEHSYRKTVTAFWAGWIAAGGDDDTDMVLTELEGWLEDRAPTTEEGEDG